MNITRTDKDELNAVISLEITNEDYDPKVEKELKAYKKTAQIKGFRPGTAPMGLIKKMVGNQILMQELDKLVSESLTNYLVEEKLDILGQPLPSDEQKPIDIENETKHEFLFDLGLAPKINITIDNKISIPYYKIKVEDKLIDDEITKHKNQFAKAEKTETIEANSYVTGNVIQIDEKGNTVEGGIFSEETMIATDIIKDEAEKKKFIGSKIDDTISFDIKKAFPNDTEIAGILKIEKDAVATITPHFNFIVSEITTYTPAEINQELFDKVFGEGTVKNDEEYRVKIKENIAKVYVDESEYRFAVDTKEKLVTEANISLPDTFLKKWLKATDREGKITEEVLEKEYPLFENDTKWQLVRSKIAKDQDFKVTEEELRNESRKFTEAQFIQYGLPLSALPEEQMAGFIDKNLEKEEDRNRFAERAIETKIMSFIKDNVKLVEKEISIDELKELYEKNK